MIRRLFWLVVGAAAGIAGYRRAARLARSVSPGARVRRLSRFTDDVREGMELYMERQPGHLAPTVGSHQWDAQIAGAPQRSRTNHVKDGR